VTADQGPRSGVSGIVLAGGRGSRFGGPKLEADLRGRPLVQHAIGAVAEVADEVVVVVAPGVDVPLSVLPIPIRLVHDSEPDAGPLVGLVEGLRTAGEGRAIVVGGDMPSLVPAVLVEMLRQLEASGARAVILEAPGDGSPASDRPPPRQTLPLALRVEDAAVAAEAAVARGKRALQAMLDDLVLSEVPRDAWRRIDPEAATLVDVDEPADLDRLRRGSAGPRGGSR
jgi:molybdopterin-guanine dinucleotide biosynthesis protein A